MLSVQGLFCCDQRRYLRPSISLPALRAYLRKDEETLWALQITVLDDSTWDIATWTYKEGKDMKLSEIEQKKNEFNDKIKQLLTRVVRDETVVREKLSELGLNLDRKAGCSFYLTKIKGKDGTLSKNYYLYATVYTPEGGTKHVYLCPTNAKEEDHYKLLELSILFEQLDCRAKLVSRFTPTPLKKLTL